MQVQCGLAEPVELSLNHWGFDASSLETPCRTQVLPSLPAAWEQERESMWAELVLHAVHTTHTRLSATIRERERERREREREREKRERRERERERRDRDKERERERRARTQTRNSTQ